ncbi:MAG: hypothetical protein C0179_03455 [Fervidicoccus sp.]|nr:MAG: hypothetical protein C0179_03455 [Fervidicoccus sp.]
MKPSRLGMMFLRYLPINVMTTANPTKEPITPAFWARTFAMAFTAEATMLTIEFTKAPKSIVGVVDAELISFSSLN